MYDAWLNLVTKNSAGQYTAHLSVDYHGVEEEARFRFDNLSKLPRHLFKIKNGKVTYVKGTVLKVSHPWEDANGLVFGYIYDENGKEAA